MIKELVRWVHITGLFHNGNLLFFREQWGVTLSVSVLHHEDGANEEENDDNQNTTDRHKDVGHNIVGVAEVTLVSIYTGGEEEMLMEHTFQTRAYLNFTEGAIILRNTISQCTLISGCLSSTLVYYFQPWCIILGTHHILTP